MHSRGVSHRDLKLENLLLDSDFNLKICDFGLATSGNLAGEKCGTENYMAPEVRELKALYNPAAADSFSAAVILFVMITQNFPFGSADAVNDSFYNLIAKNDY